MTSPFNPTGSASPTHVVLLDARGERSLWPVYLPLPPGWFPLHGPASYDQCLAHIESGA
ncbi:MbtH family NRPS accessory protein [Streptomyces sp. T-3]|nr:MbtH family NRPS accessory protein [Streptomyces sp. T-3]